MPKLDHIPNRIKILNYVGYTFIILGAILSYTVHLPLLYICVGIGAVCKITYLFKIENYKLAIPILIGTIILAVLLMIVEFY